MINNRPAASSKFTKRRQVPCVFVGGMALTSEDDLCIACVRWFDDQFGNERRFDLIHIPNEGKRSNFEGKKLQRMGLRAGTPDYLVSSNGKPIGWMEFKFGKNTLEPTQKEFKNYCETNGFNYAEIRSIEQFKAVLEEWGVYNPEKQERERTSRILKLWRSL